MVTKTKKPPKTETAEKPASRKRKESAESSTAPSVDPAVEKPGDPTGNVVDRSADRNQPTGGAVGDSAMHVEEIAVADLSGDPANVRQHDERNIATIMGSLRRFGQQKPIVVDANNIVRAGNGTLEAAVRLGWQTIKCVRSSLSGPDMVAYAIADNRTTDLSTFAVDTLRAQLESLDADLLACAGYDQDELDMLGADMDEDDEPVLGESYAESFQVIVECSDEASQRAIFEKLQGQGYKIKCLQV